MKGADSATDVGHGRRTTGSARTNRAAADERDRDGSQRWTGDLRKGDVEKTNGSVARNGRSIFLAGEKLNLPIDIERGDIGVEYECVDRRRTESGARHAVAIETTEQSRGRRARRDAGKTAHDSIPDRETGGVD